MRRSADQPRAVAIHDDVGQLCMLDEVLGERGLTADTFTSVKSALVAMDGRSPPALIAAAAYLPDINGWDLCRMLRSGRIRELGEVPVLLVSGMSMGTQAERLSRLLGADAFLQPPFTRSEVGACVDRLLAEGRAAAGWESAVILSADEAIVETTRRAFGPMGLDVVRVLKPSRLFGETRRSCRKLIIVDTASPSPGARHLIGRIRKHAPLCTIVAAMREPSCRETVELMQSGAGACLPVPLEAESLKRACELACAERVPAETRELLSRHILELCETRIRCCSIMEAMDDLVYIVSPDYRIEFLSSACRRYIGRDVTGEHCYSALHHRATTCPVCPMDAVQRGETVRYEMEMGRNHTVFHACCTPLVHADGSISIMSILRDVTEIRRMQVRSARSEKMEAVGMLAGGVAHDFNNMLGAILGYADMIGMANEDADGRPVDARLQYRVDTILAAARRASVLVKQLLAFGRRERHRIEPVSVHELIREVVALLEHSIDKRIEIVARLDAVQCTILGVPSQIQSVLLNLAVNARDAMPAGGELRFETTVVSAGAEQGTAKPGSAAKMPYLCISVIDDGEGMSEEVRSRAFEPFFTTKPPGQGTGLGLASAYSTARDHGGFIEVDSEPGKGAAFRLHLPLAPHAPQSEGQGGRDIQPGTGRVMIVDDEVYIAEVAKDMLCRAGYEAVSFSSCREAIEYYRVHHQAVDLVLIDMIMPERNGRQCFEELKAIDPGVRAALITGYAVNGEVQRALDEGVIAIIDKPFDAERLTETVYAIVNKKPDDGGGPDG